MKNISCYGFLLKLTDYLLFAGLTHAAILSADRQALTALYNSADGDGWDDKNSWKTPPPRFRRVCYARDSVQLVWRAMRGRRGK